MGAVVYNSCFGGFSLSKKALLWLAEHGHAEALAEIATQEDQAKSSPKDEFDKWANERWQNGDTSNNPPGRYSWIPSKMNRADPLLVQCVKILRDEASGECAALSLKELPSGARYRIDAYYGNESITVEGEDEWSVVP